MNPSCKKLPTRDRLTELPDRIRLHILTLLPIKDAIHTSLLSKPWINLWSHLPTLVFRFDDNADIYVTEFTSFVDRVLLFHTSQHLDTFSVSFYFSQYHDKYLHSWLRFALNRGVKHLRLLSHFGVELEDDDLVCTIPSFLFQNDPLLSLNFKSCRLIPCAPEIKCKSLTSLSLTTCSLDDGLMEKLLSGCPVLETLKLVDCCFYVDIDCEEIVDLNIYHDGLKQLVINGSTTMVHGMLRISAPNLTLLSLSHYLLCKCQLSNLFSLEEAFIDLRCLPISPAIGLRAKHVLAGMPNVKKLTFETDCVQALSLLDATHLPFSLSSCTSLVLHNYLNTSQLRGVAWLIRSCPQLETLTLNIMATESSSEKEDIARTSFWKSEHTDGYFNSLDHLKYVNVIGAVPILPNQPETKYVTEFLQFILQHGKVLKKLFIKAGQNDEGMSDDYSILKSQFELSQMLLSFPRLSREAEIHFTVL